MATHEEYAKSGVHWSWGNRQTLGKKVFSQKLSQRIVDPYTSTRVWELTKKLVGLIWFSRILISQINPYP